MLWIVAPTQEKVFQYARDNQLFRGEYILITNNNPEDAKDARITRKETVFLDKVNINQQLVDQIEQIFINNEYWDRHVTVYPQDPLH